MNTEPQNGEDQEPKQTAEADEQHAAADQPAADEVMADDVMSAEGLNTELQQHLVEAQDELQKAKDQVLRAHAEMENVRRRATQDIEKARKFGVEKLANEMLPLKESLDMGLAAASGEGADLAQLREGMELTQKQFLTAFGKIGIEELDPVGEAFNPEFHEAMVMQPSAEAEPNSVLQVIQKGYLLNGRLMRPARVIVSREPD